jgi:hypothetical protein
MLQAIAAALLLSRGTALETNTVHESRRQHLETIARTSTFDLSTYNGERSSALGQQMLRDRHARLRGVNATETGKGRKILFWTYCNAQEGDAMFWGMTEAHTSSITTVAPISYVLDLNGELSCMNEPYDQARTECPEWDARHARLQQNFFVQPTISLPPGYQGDGVMKLLSSSTLQTKFIYDAVALATASGFEGYNIDFENSGRCDMLNPAAECSPPLVRGRWTHGGRAVGVLDQARECTARGW